MKARTMNLKLWMLGAVALAWLLCGHGHAATVTWEGDVNTSWSTAGNWSTGAVPASGDTVVFNGTSSVNCTLSAAATITNLQLASGYNGTLTLSGNLTITGDLTLSSGTLSPGSTTLNVRKSITVSGGTFQAGTSLLDLTTSSAANISGTFEVYNLTINKAAHVTVNNAVTVNGTLTLTAGYLDTGDVLAKGNVVQGTGFDGGTGRLIFSGIQNHTFTGSGSNVYGQLPEILVDKSGGTLTLASTIRTYNGWTHVSGTVEPGTSILRMQGATDVGLRGQGVFNEIMIAKSTAARIVTLDDHVEVRGNFTLHTGTLNMADGKALRVAGVVDLITATVNPGTSTLEINGIASQTVDLNSKNFHHVLVSNNQGTVTLLRGFVASGTVTFVPGSSIVFGYNHTFTMGALAWNGTPVQPIVLRSSHASYNWKLSTSAQTVTYVDVQRSNAISGTITALQSFDAGNNTNWTFPAPNAVWDGGGADNNWSTAANWSGDLVPGFAASVTFNGTSSKNCTVDVPARVTSLSLASGWSGTATLNANLIVDQTLTVSAGTLNANASNIVMGAVSITGGTLAAGSGTHRVTGNFSKTGGQFQRNTSTLVFEGSSDSSVSGSVQFHNLEVDKATANYLHFAGTTLETNGLLHLKAGKSGSGTIQARGDVTQGLTFDASASYLQFTGSSDQTLTGNGSTTQGVLPELNVSKSGGTLTLASTLCLTRNVSVSTGSMSGGTSNVVFKGGNAPVLQGNFTFNDVEIALNNGTALTVAANSVVVSTGALTLTEGAINRAAGQTTGDWEARGNVNVATTFDGGTGWLAFGGSADHTFTGAGSNAAGELPEVEIRKTGGTLTLASTIRTLTHWHHTSGTVNGGDSTVILRGAGPISITGNATFGSLELVMSAQGKIINIDGNVTVQKNYLQSPGTITLTNGSTFTAQGDVVLGNAVLNTSTAKFIVGGSGSQSIDLENATWQEIEVSNSTGAVTFETGFQALGECKLCPGSNITFKYNQTFQCGSLNWVGTQAAPIVLRSSHGTYTWKLDCATPQFVNCVDVQRSNAITATITAYRSTNSGGNINWIFPASTSIWDGGGADNNWTTAANWSDDVVPSPYSDVIFNGTSAKNCTANFGTGQVYSLSVNAGYIGTLTLQGVLSIEKDYVQQAGTVSMQSNSVNLKGNLTFSGGQITDTNGTFTLVEGSDSTITGTPDLGTLVINKGAHVLNIATLARAKQAVTLTSGELASGVLEVEKNVTQQSAFRGGAGTIKFVAGNSQTLTGSGNANSDLPSIEINKSGGTWRPSGTIYSSRNWTHVAGSMPHTTGTTIVLKGSGVSILTGALLFNDVRINSTGSVLVADNSTISIEDDLFLDAGAISQSVTPAGGTFRVKGDITLGTVNFSSGRLVATGNDSHSVSDGVAANSPWLPNLYVDKSGGTFELNNYVRLNGDLIVTAGTLSQDNEATIEFGGTQDSTTSGFNLFKTLKVNKSNTGSKLALAQNVTVTKYLNVVSGILDCTDRTVVIRKDLTIDAAGSLIGQNATFEMNANGNKSIRFRSQTVKDVKVTNTNSITSFLEGFTATGSAQFVAGSQVKFQPSETFTFSSLAWTGTQANPVSLRSVTDGQAWNLSAPAQSVSYVDVKDSNATNGTITATWSTDSGNNTNWVFQNDVTPPEVANVVPADGANVGTVPTQVTGEFTDAQPSSGINAASFTLSGWHGEVGSEQALTIQPAEVVATALGFTFTPAAGFTQGRYRFEATVADTAGNVSAIKAWSFRVDSVAPVISGLTPSHNAASQSAPASISASFSDAGPSSGISTNDFLLAVRKGAAGQEQSITVNPAMELAVTTSGFNYTPTTALAAGRYVLEPSIRDVAGNQSAPVSWLLYVDQSAPSLANQTPAPNAFVGTATPQISASFVDGGEGAGLDLQIADSAVITFDDFGRIDQLPEMSLTATGFTYTHALALGAGPHTVSVTLKDRAGNTSAQLSWTFTVDLSPPAVTQVSPTDNSDIKDATPELAITFADVGGAGVDPDDAEAIVVEIQGGAYATWTRVDELVGAVESATTFALTLDELVDGAYSARVTLKDKAGNTSGAYVWAFRLDSAVPSIADLAPANGAIVATASPAISATFADIGWGVDPNEVIVLLNGDAVEVTVNQVEGPLGRMVATGFELMTSGLDEDIQEVSVTIQDYAGNEGVQEWSFTVDLTPPQLSELVPAPWSATSEQLPEISATWEDIPSGINFSAAKVYLDEEEVGAVKSATGFTYTPAALDDGVYVVRVELSDMVGNADEVIWNFQVDTAPPEISNLLPGHGAFVKSDTPMISATFSDPGLSSGVNPADVIVEVGGQPVSVNILQVEDSWGRMVATGFEYIPTIPLEEISHDIQVTIKDYAGNQTVFSTWTITVDITPPEISSFEPAHEAELFDTTPEIVVAYEDENSGINTASVTLEISTAPQSIVPSGTGFTYIPEAPLEYTEHDIEVTVSDFAGNTTVQGWSFTIVDPGDITPPVIYAVEPFQAFIKNSRPLFRAAYIDSGDGIDLATVRGYVNTGDITPLATVTADLIEYTPADPLPDGPYTWEVNVSDLAENAGNASVAFVLDTVAPLVQPDSPQQGSWEVVKRPEIRVTASDERSGLHDAAVQGRIDGILVPVTTTETGYKISPTFDLQEGERSISFTIFDRAGNSASTSWTFSVDTRVPVVSGVVPEDGTYLEDARPVFSGVFEDSMPGSGVDWQNIKIFSGTQEVTSQATIDEATFTYVPSADLDNGTVSYRAEIPDLAGNLIVIVRDILVDVPVIWDGGGVTENWSEGANWLGDQVPTISDRVVFGAPFIKSSVVDMPTSIRALDVQPDSDASIALLASLDVQEHIELRSGQLNGGASTLTVHGNFMVEYSHNIHFSGGTIQFNGIGDSEFTCATLLNANMIIEKGSPGTKVRWTTTQGGSLSELAVNGSIEVRRGTWELTGASRVTLYEGDLLISESEAHVTPELSEIKIDRFEGGTIALGGHHFFGISIYSGYDPEHTVDLPNYFSADSLTLHGISTFRNGASINTLSLEIGAHPKFSPGTTLAVNRFYAKGNTYYNGGFDPSISMSSIVVGQPWNFILTNPANVEAVYARDSHANLGSPVFDLYGFDGGNNQNWAFGYGWTGGGSNNDWHTPGNWSGGKIPGDGDEAIFLGDEFNPSSSACKDCYINQVATTVKNIYMGPNYSGRLFIEKAFAVTGNGKFENDKEIHLWTNEGFTIGGDLVLGGTDLHLNDSELSVEGNCYVRNDAVLKSGTQAIEVGGDLFIGSGILESHAAVSVSGKTFTVGGTTEIRLFTNELCSFSGGLDLDHPNTYCGDSVLEIEGAFILRSGTWHLQNSQMSVRDSMTLVQDVQVHGGANPIYMYGDIHFGNNTHVFNWGEPVFLCGGPSSLSGFARFENLTISKDSASIPVSVTGTLDVGRAMECVQGVLALSDPTIMTMSGDLTIAPEGTTLQLGKSSLRFVSGDDQEVVLGAQSIGNLTVSKSGGSVTFLDDVSVGSDCSATFSPGSAVVFQPGVIFTCDTLYWIGTSQAPIVLRSSTPGNSWFLNTPGATAAFVDVADSDASSGGVIRAYSSIDSGNNLNWVFGLTDTDPPVISSLVPADGSYVSQNRPVMSAIFSDPGIGIDLRTTTVILDGNLHVKPQTLSSMGFTYQSPTGLAQGSHTLEVRVKDLAGQETIASSQYVIDSIFPQVTSLTPSSGLYTNNPFVAFAASYADNAGGTGIDPASVSVSLNAETATGASIGSTDMSFTYPGGLPADGLYTLSVVVPDRAGNTITRSTSVWLDTEGPPAPVIEKTIKSAGQVVVTGPLPTTDVVSSMVVTATGANYQAQVFSNSYAVIFTNPGTDPTFDFTLQFVDLAGNLGEVTTVATEPFEGNGDPEDPPPALEIVGFQIKVPTDKLLIDRDGTGLTNSSSIEVNYAFAGGQGPFDIEVLSGSVNSSQEDATERMGTTALSGLEEGMQSVTVTVTDDLGSVATIAATLISDRTPPKIQMITPLKPTTADLKCLVLGPKDLEVFSDPATQDPETLRNVFGIDSFSPEADIVDEHTEPAEIIASVRVVGMGYEGLFRNFAADPDSADQVGSAQRFLLSQDPESTKRWIHDRNLTVGLLEYARDREWQVKDQNGAVFTGSEHAGQFSWPLDVRYFTAHTGYQLILTARDILGNETTQRVLNFVVDRTPPALRAVRVFAPILSVNSDDDTFILVQGEHRLRKEGFVSRRGNSLWRLAEPGTGNIHLYAEDIAGNSNSSDVEVHSLHSAGITLGNFEDGGQPRPRAGDSYTARWVDGSGQIITTEQIVFPEDIANKLYGFYNEPEPEGEPQIIRHTVETPYYDAASGEPRTIDNNNLFGPFLAYPPNGLFSAPQRFVLPREDEDAEPGNEASVSKLPGRTWDLTIPRGEDMPSRQFGPDPLSTRCNSLSIELWDGVGSGYREFIPYPQFLDLPRVEQQSATRSDVPAMGPLFIEKTSEQSWVRNDSDLFSGLPPAFKPPATEIKARLANLRRDWNPGWAGLTYKYYNHTSPALSVGTYHEAINLLKVEPSTWVSGQRMQVRILGAELVSPAEQLDLGAVEVTVNGQPVTGTPDGDPNVETNKIIVHRAAGAFDNQKDGNGHVYQLAGDLRQCLLLEMTVGEDVPLGPVSIVISPPDIQEPIVLAEGALLIRYEVMVVNKETGEIEPMEELPVSDPAPIVKLDYSEFDLGTGTAAESLTGTLRLSGTIRSGVCDITPGQEGVIDHVEVYLNGETEPVATVPVQVTKASGGPLNKPYAYEGTFDTAVSISGVVLGPNQFRVLAEDNVYGREGVSDFSITVAEKAISDPDPTHESSGGLGFFQQPYKVQLNLNGIAGLEDLENGTEIPAVVTSAVSNQIPAINVNLTKVGENPLTLAGPSLSVTIIDEDQFAQTLAGTANSFVALADAPTFSFMHRSLTFVRGTGSLFQSAHYQVELAFSGTGLNVLQAKVRSGGGAWQEETLQKQSGTAGTYANADSSFVVSTRGLALSTTKKDGLSVKVTHTGLGLVAFGIDALESAVDSNLFATSNFNVPFIPFAFDEEGEVQLGQPGPLLVSDAEKLFEPDEEDIQPLVVRVEGDPSIILKESFRVSTREGERKIVQGPDGYYYLASDDGEQVAVALAMRSTEPQAADPLPGFDMEGEEGVGERAAVRKRDLGDSAEFLGGFTVGFFEGGVDLVVGVIKLGWWAVNKVARSHTDRLVKGWCYFLEPDTYNAIVAREQRQRDAIIEDVKNFAKIVGDLWLAGAEAQLDIFFAIVNRDVAKLGKISEKYAAVLELCYELIGQLIESYAYMPPYEQGRIFGLVMFEIVGALIPATKAGKLEKLNVLRKSKFFKELTVLLEKVAVKLKGTARKKLRDIIAWCSKSGDEFAKTPMCFPSGTLVHTRSGKKPIETVQPGEWVLSRDEVTGRQAHKRVLRRIVTYPVALVSIFYAVLGQADTQERSLSCTLSHPFYEVSQGKFVEAGALKIGARLYLKDGSEAAVQRIKHVTQAESFVCYNFDVSDYHTYFVGVDGVWVHNQGVPCDRIAAVYKSMRSRGVTPQEAVKVIEKRLPRMDIRHLGDALEEVLKKDVFPGNNGPLWTMGPQPNYGANIWRHWKDHKGDFTGRIDDVVSYVQQAKAFVEQPLGTAVGRLKIGTRKVRDHLGNLVDERVVLDTVTGDFSVQIIGNSAEIGAIKTYFVRRNNPLQYFLDNVVGRGGTVLQ